MKYDLQSHPYKSDITEVSSLPSIYQPHLMIRNHFVCSCYSWLNLYFQGSWWDYISFTLPYQDMYVFTYMYFLSFFKVGCLFPPNQHVYVHNQQTSSVSLHPPFVGIPHPFIVSRTRRGSCPPCYRNWVPRSPSRLLPPLPSKCPCASGRQAEGRWGEAAKKAYFFGGILCISQGTCWSPNKMDGEWFRWFSLFSWVNCLVPCELSGMYGQMMFDLMCTVYAGLVC